MCYMYVIIVFTLSPIKVSFSTLRNYIRRLYIIANYDFPIVYKLYIITISLKAEPFSPITEPDLIKQFAPITVPSDTTTLFKFLYFS